MKLCYISGKYFGETNDETYENIQIARKAAVMLWCKGWAVICPHLNTAFMDGIVPLETFLQGDFEMVSRCDAVFMLPNWQDSKGAKRERECAYGAMKPVHYLEWEDVK